MKISRLTLIFLIISAISYSCDRDNNSPGYNYYPDMYDSRAYEPYSENPEGGPAMLLPPEGSIPRGYAPLPYTKELSDRTRAGRELTNPFAYTPENLERGKIMYDRICLMCHGLLGDGKGHLYTSGLYNFPPASLINKKVDSLADGEIFHTITYGFGVMPEHATIVQPDDRWKIILYIRKDLHKN